MATLPIHAFKDDLLALVEDNTAVVVVGATGSGKTTQLPQFLLEAGYGERGLIGVTQPRRIAAISVATRVCQERKCKLGDEVSRALLVWFIVVTLITRQSKLTCLNTIQSCCCVLNKVLY